MTTQGPKAGGDQVSDRPGTLLLVLSALAFSTAGLFTRLAPVPLSTMVFWRNAFGCVGLLFILTLRGRSLVEFRQLRLRGWIATGCSALASVCYLAAFSLTRVADIAIIYATAPLVGAGLAWITLRERPASRTLTAAGVALIGVAITLSGATTSGSLAGDGLALGMTVALASVAVLVRGTAVPPLATACGSAFLAAAAMLPFSALPGATLGIGLGDGLVLALFGAVTMTLALPAYLAGAARVPAGRALLISALELPFAPLWIFMAWGEVPAVPSLVGGALVLAAVLFDLWPPGPERKGAPKRPIPPSD